MLWDESEKRGWLVNGTSALLHLTRASLEADGNPNDKFKSVFLFDSKSIKEAETGCTSTSAVKVLLNRENMRLAIYPRKDELYSEMTTKHSQAETFDSEIVFKEKKSFVRFQDRVEHIYHILEQLIAYTGTRDAQTGVNVKPRLRKHLEGWDFVDVSENRDPFYPRVATIDSIGKGWVDFVRNIHPVPLFGRGFGEVIKPSEASTCLRWSSLPKDQYYLAASVLDLKQIVKEYGNGGADPVELCEDKTVWYNPSQI
jgi:hypothetical protein